MNFRIKLVIPIIFCIVASVYHPVAAQKIGSDIWSESGIPVFHNYTAREYNAHFQNWAIIQDKQGIILVANNDGLLEYDGENWRRYDLEDKLFHSLRSMAVDRYGTIYCGSGSHFGYITADKTGNYNFRSLLDKVDKKYHNFNDVWYTLILDSSVFFVTHKYLFHWEKGNLSVIEADDPDNIFHTAFVIHHTLFVRQSGVGLMWQKNGKLELIPDGKKFASIPVYMMEQFDDKSILIGTAENGFFLLRNNQIEPFPTQADVFLNEHHLYCGKLLKAGYYALGTRTGGLGIMDREGMLLKIFDTSQGLQDNSVWYIYLDVQENLWLALNNGITRVELPSPVSVFRKENGLEGTVENVVRHNGKIYVATNLGIFYLDDATGEDGWKFPRFQPVSGLNEYGWCLLSHQNILLAGTTGGVYQITGSRSAKIKGKWSSVFEIVPSKFYPGYFYLAERNGVGLLKLEQGRWVSKGFLPGISEKIYHVVETDSETLWLETAGEGVLRVKWSGDYGISFEQLSVEVDRFGSSQNLPEERIYPISIKKQLYFSTPQGMYEFNESNENFSPAAEFNLPKAWGYLGTVDLQGNLWLSRFDKFGGDEEVRVGIPLENGNNSWDERFFPEIPEISHVNTIYPENENIFWIGSSEGLIRYDRRLQTSGTAKLNSLIRRVTVNNDSIIFYGSPVGTIPELQFRYNNIRFEFALTNFKKEHKNIFQTYLQGFDREWSSWKTESQRDYTNLPKGDYNFRVRGQSSSGVLGIEASYQFIILPPWYQTTWAYLTYALVFIFAIFTADRLQRRRLTRIEQQKARLREAEIVRVKNIELERTLKALDLARAKLERSESRFRSVVQTANDAIISADKRGKIIFWNKHAQSIFGYSPEEVIDRDLTILMPERYRSDHLAGLNRYMNKGETRMMGKVTEVYGLHKTGSEFPIELTIAEWTTDEGEFVTGIIRDISMRRAEQEAKEKALAQLEEENRRKTEELQKACDLQHSMLPKEIPQTDQLEISTYMRTAIEVGGDYYDFHTTENGELTAIIGDATGHGLEAGMMVASTKSLLTSLAWENSLITIFEQANQVFKNLNLRNMYMALQMVKINEYKLEICSAGMPPVLIYRTGSKTVEEIIIKAMPLGIFNNVSFQMETTEVKRGDTILLMSDGFAERFNEKKDIIGFDETNEIFKDVADKTPDEIITHLVSMADKWANGEPQNDDITFVVIKVK